MENKMPVNRIAYDLKNWEAREQRFNKMFAFGENSNRELMKEKLRFFDALSVRYRDTIHPDERLALNCK